MANRALLSELEVLEAELCRRSLRFFVEKAWPLAEPTVPFVGNWHIDILCSILERVSAGDPEFQKLIINVPPGTMKSYLVSVLWPAWEWATRPQLKYLTFSYAASLSLRDSLRLRNVITSDWYQRHFAVSLSEDQNAKGRYETTAGGFRIASSITGVGTGEHPDRIIIDDPLSASQARSEVERLAVNTWYDSTLSTRGVSRGAAIVLIMQRLHIDDLTGHLLARNSGWTHICWPMEYSPKWPPVKDKWDPRSKPGELLWPELFTKAKVREMELSLGEYDAAGQLSQNPIPPGGAMFKREWFTVVEKDAVPKGGITCRGWDTAGTDGGGDWTVGVRIRYVDQTFYVEDVVRGQWSAAAVEKVFKQMSVLDGRLCRIREEQEPGSAGKAVVSIRAKQLAGFDYASVSVTGDKQTRAKPLRAQAEAGNVKIVAAPWTEAYLQELCAFPFGKHDDQVDASATSFNELTTRPVGRVVSASWG